MMLKNRNRNRDEGSMVLLFAFALIALIGLGAIAADTGFLTMGSTKVQTATEASALSAAGRLDGTNNGVTASLQAATRVAANHEVAGDALEVSRGNLNYGTWNERTRRFDPSDDVAAANAVELNTRHTMTTAFGRVFGRDSVTKPSKALAIGGGPVGARVAPIILARGQVMGSDGPQFGRTYEVSSDLGASGAAMFATLNGSFSGTGSQVDAYFDGRGIELTMADRSNGSPSRVTAFSGPWMNDQWDRWATRCPVGAEIRVPVVAAANLGRCQSYAVDGFATVRVESFNLGARSINVRLIQGVDRDARAGGPNLGTRAARVFLASNDNVRRDERSAPNVPNPFPVCGCPQPAPPRRAD